MENEGKKRIFESEFLILPALKMVLVEPEPKIRKPIVRNAQKPVRKDFTEETVMRLISKLSLKD